MKPEDNKYTSTAQNQNDLFETLENLVSSSEEIVNVCFYMDHPILRSIDISIFPDSKIDYFTDYSIEGVAILGLLSLSHPFTPEKLQWIIDTRGSIPIYYVLSQINSCMDGFSPTKRLESSLKEVLSTKVEKCFYDLCSIDEQLDYTCIREFVFPACTEEDKSLRVREYKMYNQKFFMGLANILQNQITGLRDHVVKEVLRMTDDATAKLKQMTLNDRQGAEPMIREILLDVSKLSTETKMIVEQFEKLSISTSEEPPVKEEPPFSLTITGFNIGKPVLYTLNVVTPDSSYQLAKRYSEFSEFNLELRKIPKKFTFPAFPEKILIGNTQEGNLEKRMNVLNTYLTAIASQKDFYTHVTFKKFISK